MASFSEGFLSALMRPSFGQNLFQVGQQIGQAPALYRANQKQKEKMGMLRSMGDVERADYMASIAKTPDELLKAEAAKDAAIKKSSLTSLQGLEAARQAAETDEEKTTHRRYNESSCCASRCRSYYYCRTYSKRS